MDEVYDRTLRYSVAVAFFAWCYHMYSTYMEDTAVMDKVVLALFYAGTIGALTYIVILAMFELYNSEFLTLVQESIPKPSTQVESNERERRQSQLPPDVGSVRPVRIVHRQGEYAEERINRTPTMITEVVDDDSDEETATVLEQSRADVFQVVYQNVDSYIRAKISGQRFIIGDTSHEYVGSSLYLKGVVTYYWETGEIYFSRTAIADHNEWPRLDKTVDQELLKLEGWLVEKELLTPHIVSHNRKLLTSTGQLAFPSPNRSV